MAAERTGFSSAGLISLAAEVLAEIDQSLVPGGFSAPDPLDEALAPETTKAGLLEHALAVGGAVPLLSVGQELRRLEPSPTLAALRGSASVAVLAEKWNRFGRYHHARNRADVTVAGCRAEVRRYSVAGPAPTPAENVFIAGVLAGLVGLLPVRDVALEVGSWRGAPPEWLPELPVEGCDRFAVTWTDGPELVGQPVGSPDVAEGFQERLVRLLGSDVGRGWRIGDAARALAVSTRSLQRRLAEDGRSFSTELRRVRVAEAGRMLADGTAPLAEVGYCCGYADQAHFQREFARMTGLTPRAYRQISAG